MRKIPAVLLLAFTVLACSPAKSRQSFAQLDTQTPRANLNHDKQQPTYVVKAIKANLRQRPSRTSPVVAKVAKGDSLIARNSAGAGPWYEVREQQSGIEGWIHGNLISPLSKVSVTTPRPLTTKNTKPIRGERSYINVDGERVRSPTFSDTRPSGASARCRDGSYSFSRNRRGTCSHHGGVAVWF